MLPGRLEEFSFTSNHPQMPFGVNLGCHRELCNTAQRWVSYCGTASSW